MRTRCLRVPDARSPAQTIRSRRRVAASVSVAIELRRGSLGRGCVPAALPRHDATLIGNDVRITAQLAAKSHANQLQPSDGFVLLSLSVIVATIQGYMEQRIRCATFCEDCRSERWSERLIPEQLSSCRSRMNFSLTVQLGVRLI